MTSAASPGSDQEGLRGAERPGLKRIATTVPLPCAGDRISSEFVSDVISGTPSPSPGLSERGINPQPWSLTVTRTAPSSRSATMVKVSSSDTWPSRYAWTTAFAQASDTARATSAIVRSSPGIHPRSHPVTKVRAAATLSGRAAKLRSNPGARDDRDHR
jgi:hypothetical protein